MSHTHHKLTSQLSEHADKIKTLKKKDPHFAKLAKRYNRNNRKIKAYESGVKATPKDNTSNEAAHSQHT